MPIENTQKTTPNASPEDAGAIAALKQHTPDIIKDNAPRVVAGLKILGVSSMLFSKNRVFSVAGGLFTVAFGTMAFYGGKKTEAEKEALRQEAEKNPTENGQASFLTKAMNPKKYPIESGTSIAMAASSFWTAAGIWGKGGFSPGRLAGGLLSLSSDANIVLTKEKIGEAEENPYKKGSFNYYKTELKHRPVLLSSMLNIGSDVASIVGGGYEYFRKGREPNTLIAGGLLLLANTFQGIYVNKNDYNIEASNKDITTKEPATNTPQTTLNNITTHKKLIENTTSLVKV
jgi:hypothetical protein